MLPRSTKHRIKNQSKHVSDFYPILTSKIDLKWIQNDAQIRFWATMGNLVGPKGIQKRPINPQSAQNTAQETPKWSPWHLQSSQNGALEPPRAPKMNPKDSLGTEMDANREKDSHTNIQTDPIRNFRPQLNGIWDQLSWIPSHLSSIRSQLIRVRIKLTGFRIQRSRSRIQLKNSYSVERNSNSTAWNYY